MLCQKCGQRLATVRVTRAVNGQERTEFLCDRCAAAPGQGADSWWEDLFGSILPGPSLFGYPSYPGSPHRGPARRVCPSCGETERELRESGLLGCGQCYDTFAAVLEPVFRRVQGHTRHIEPMEKEDLPAEVTDLRKKLARAIEDEAYEEAAKIRDRIRAHEAQKEGED
ncbi:MAG TPA: UvrB/UvrC motif-containing protein [Bacillota bacterium]|jgi:protein arginine kinase activator|nr:hypothetical protein [Fastidiosipila sp.]HPX93655.1 UvrB/UvrC motif-containing protein [Bacillota bacterium]HQB81554.1 UvrB/UvrC motif-containing protein [Bacillota bacterium]